MIEQHYGELCIDNALHASLEALLNRYNILGQCGTTRIEQPSDELLPTSTRFTVKPNAKCLI